MYKDWVIFVELIPTNTRRNAYGFTVFTTSSLKRSHSAAHRLSLRICFLSLFLSLFAETFSALASAATVTTYPQHRCIGNNPLLQEKAPMWRLDGFSVPHRRLYRLRFSGRISVSIIYRDWKRKEKKIPAKERSAKWQKPVPKAFCAQQSFITRETPSRQSNSPLPPSFRTN